MDTDMRYYRTKDGRVFKETDIPNYWGGLVAMVGLDLDYETSMNLEDLFDAYVGMDESGPHYMSKAVYRAFSHKLSKRNIYGGIWVFDADNVPTFKPVAKLTEEGWKLL